MKSKITNLFFLLTLFVGLNLFAQQKVQIQLNVFQPLPEVSFAAFLSNPFLENTPRIFQVTMSPHGVKVYVKGAILWRKLNEASYKELADFTTKPFLSRDFSNDDISSISGIQLEEKNINDGLLDENKDKGKPTGTYKIVLKVFDENGVPQSSASEEIDFTNPSQTITIIEPINGEIYDVGGITISWTDVPGVSEYFIKANIRDTHLQSLEEALQHGTPVVKNQSVGKNTSVNLRAILDRELVGGEEVVVQVRGVVNVPGSKNIIYSNIVDFYLKGANTHVVDKGIKDLETLILESLKDMDAKGAKNSKGYAKLKQLLEDLQNGDISFDKVKIRAGNGRILTFAEFQELLTKLRNNPELISSITFIRK